MTLRTDRNKTPGLALLLLSACAVAVLLAAGCGDRGGGMLSNRAPGDRGLLLTQHRLRSSRPVPAQMTQLSPLTLRSA